MIYLLFCLVATQAIYTNRQALNCFEEKAVGLCKQQMDLCSSTPACRDELEKYSKCSFGSSTAEEDHVFNGNCFSRWRKEAAESKEVIDCWAESCDLEYNSQIGVIELFKCTEWAIRQDDIDCGLECIEQISRRIRANFHTVPILELFSQQFINDQAGKLAALIRKQCLEKGGKGRSVIEEQARSMTDEDNREQL